MVMMVMFLMLENRNRERDRGRNKSFTYQTIALSTLKSELESRESGGQERKSGGARVFE